MDNILQPILACYVCDVVPKPTAVAAAIGEDNYVLCAHGHIICAGCESKCAIRVSPGDLHRLCPVCLTRRTPNQYASPIVDALLNLLV